MDLSEAAGQWRIETDLGQEKKSEKVDKANIKAITSHELKVMAVPVETGLEPSCSLRI